MAFLYKRARSPYWYIRYLDEAGRKISESTGMRLDSVNETREARKLRATREVIERSAAPRERGERDLRNWVPRWLASSYKNQETTLEAYLGAFEGLMTYFESLNVSTASQITRKMCFDYIDWRQLRKKGDIDAKTGRNTAIQHLRILRLILNEALAREHITANPAAKMGLKPDAAAEKSEITEEQRTQVEASLTADWQKVSWAIAIRQGCRLAETALPLSDIDFENDTITFTIKGRRRHTTRLIPDLKPILLDLKEKGHKWTWGPYRRNASRDWSRHLKRVGMPFTFHSTRVTVITKLARAGVNEQQAIRFIGHCSSEVHQIYTKLRVCDLDACAVALSLSPLAAPKAGGAKRARDKPGRAGIRRRGRTGRRAS